MEKSKRFRLLKRGLSVSLVMMSVLDRSLGSSMKVY